MAIKYYTGVPRSGKSYKAVNLLFYTFVEPKYKTYIKLSDYVLKDNEVIVKESPFLFFKIYKIQTIDLLNAYTNINEFNFSISPNILPLDFNVFYNKLKVLHSFYLMKKPDSELIDKAIELNIYKSLFVIDECHNFLKSKEDSVLVWWFTYHAHLHHEIILITQDLTLVNSEYKRVAEYFYKAIPARFRVRKDIFKYIQYSTFGMYDKDKIGVDSVKTEQRIFDLYVSGSDSNGKSIIHKYILFALLSLLICFISVFFLFDTIVPESEKKQEIEQDNKQINQTQNNINQNTNKLNNDIQFDSLPGQVDEQLKLFKFNCFDTLCYYKKNDLSIMEIPQNILKTYLLNINDNNKYLELKNNKLTIYVLVNENKFNFIKEEVVKNEENKTDISNSIFGK